MTRAKGGNAAAIHVPAWGHEPDFRLYIVYTDPESTRAAIGTACRLAGGLKAQLILLVAKVVPHPLPLDSPPVPQAFTEALVSRFAAGLKTALTVRITLCRDSTETIRKLLEPGSLVVIGRRKRWWPTRMPALGRLLQRDGHHVVLAGSQPTQPARIEPQTI